MDNLILLPKSYFDGLNQRLDEAKKQCIDDINKLFDELVELNKKQDEEMRNIIDQIWAN